MRTLVGAALVLLVALVLTDACVRAGFPTTSRLSDDFSSAYLRMDVDRLRNEPPTTVFLGDSVLWGYRLKADQAAPALVAAGGVRDANLAYEGGSPANTYAMLRLLLARGVRPALVVFNVNQKTFNPADSAYAKLHPSVSALALPLFSPADAALLAAEPPKNGLEDRLDRAVSSVWRLYAIRTDLRELLFGDVDAAHALHDLVERASGAAARDDAAHVPTPDKFEGTYDLSPIDDANVSMHFLDRTIATLRAAHVPAIAILTPTNHRLLHDYIDNGDYARNLAYVSRRLERGGIRVVDLDRAFAPRDFIDNDHLTADGNVKFAHAIETALEMR